MSKDEGLQSNADLVAWDSGAAAYSDISRLDPFKQYVDDPAFLQLLGDVSGKRLLDLGCGDGQLCRKLKTRGGLVTGVDGSAEMVKSARLADPDGDYQVVDIANDPLSFEDGLFDIITAKMVLMCVHPLDAVIRNSVRTLRYNGLFAVDIVHPPQPFFQSLDEEESIYSLPANYVYHKEGRGNITFGGEQFPFYYRPISQYVNDIIAAGLTFRRMSEVSVDETFARQYPDYATKAHEPLSMHLLFSK